MERSEYIEQLNGGCYVADTRVCLDSIVYSFKGGNSPETRRPHLEKFGRKLFQSLWRLDFLAMALKV